MFLPTVCKSSLFSAALPTLVSCHFDTMHSSGCEVISHHFNLHFPDDEWCWASFHVPVGLLHVFFGKYEFRSSAHLKIRLFMGLFTYLFILLLCIRYMICRFFFHSVGCLFILLMLSFAVQKPFDPLVCFRFCCLFLFLCIRNSEFGIVDKGCLLLRSVVSFTRQNSYFFVYIQYFSVY